MLELLCFCKIMKERIYLIGRDIADFKEFLGMCLCDEGLQVEVPRLEGARCIFFPRLANFPCLVLHVRPWSQDWLIAAKAYPDLCSMKRLEVCHARAQFVRSTVACLTLGDILYAS